MLHACRLWEIYWDSYNWASIRIPSHLLVLHHGSIANPSEQKWLLDTLGHPTPSPRAGRKGPLGRRREEAQRDQEIMLSTLFSWPLIQQDPPLSSCHPLSSFGREHNKSTKQISLLTLALQLADWKKNVAERAGFMFRVNQPAVEAMWCDEFLKFDMHTNQAKLDQTICTCIEVYW